MTTSLVGQAPPMVVPVPSVGRADAGAQRVPSEVAEQPTMVAIPLPTTGWMGLLTALVAPTVVGVTQPVRAPPMQAKVMVAVIGGSQSSAIVAVPEEPS